MSAPVISPAHAPSTRPKPAPRTAPALAWGYNNAGGLGAGGSARAPHPIPTRLPAGTIDVQGGTDFTVALTKSGEVYTWGGNRWGQLGHGTLGKVRFAAAKVAFPGNPHVTAIAVGENHALALTRGGQLYVWGRNHQGQLGDGTRTDRTTPVAVAASKVASIAAGNAFSAAITTGGGVLTWGSAVPSTDHTDPQAVAALLTARFVTSPRTLALPQGAKAAMVDAGERHLVILTTEGRLFALGSAPGGAAVVAKPAASAISGRIATISAGNNHTVALTRTGAVLTWGANYHGQLGDGTTRTADAPIAVRIPKLRGRVVEGIAAGDTTLVRTDTGAVYAWGHGGWGQLGSNAASAARPTPVPLRHDAVVTGLHAGQQHIIATIR